MIDTYYWVLMILRIKTIYIENMERIGIKLDLDEDQQPLKSLDFSKDMNYLQYFRDKITVSTKFQPLLERIYDEFISDT